MAPVSSFVSAITIVVANLIALVHGVDADEIGQCKVEPIPNVCSFLWNNGPLLGDENGIENKLYNVVDWSPEDGQGFNDGILTPDGRDKRCYANLPPLRNQPNCDTTCNLNSDDRYLAISGLEDIKGQQNNTISLKDVIGDNQTKIDDIVCTFGEFEPLTLEQREYVLTYWNSSDATDEDLKNASYVLWYAAGQFGKSSYLFILSYPFIESYSDTSSFLF